MTYVDRLREEDERRKNQRANEKLGETSKRIEYQLIEVNKKLGEILSYLKSESQN